jgi:serine/threonine protein kinase/tetratricopeptide (TPR) repeat protein
VLATGSFGPYVVDGTIGRGGMGVVYRARHRESGARVALKTVRLRSTDLVAIMRREVQALAHLRHPGVVRVVDSGVSNGTPWYAMDLLEGRTLAQWFDGTESTTGDSETQLLAQTQPVDYAGVAERVATADCGSVSPARKPAESPRSRGAKTARGPRLPLDEFLGIAARICRTLSFLHGNGFVHRDLKPENVVIQAGGDPVLVDFGLAAQFAWGGREVLDVATAAGTFAYSAPEQRTGRLVDARSDLFSLGSILYEGVTGELPFGVFGPVDSDIVEPVPPSSYVPEAAGELDDLILRLLRRNAEERLGYADDVERILVRIAHRAMSTTTEPPSAYLYRPNLAGRRPVLARLEALLADARRGRGQRAWITGESGVGKTRVVLELAARATDQGMRVITGQCSPVTADSVDGASRAAPLHPLRGFLLALLDACRSGGTRESERLLGEHGHLLIAHEPAFAELAHLEARADVDRLPETLGQARLFDCLKAALVRLARVRPLLLVLDDLQWADELTLDFLGQLGPRELETLPLVVLSTFRIEETTPRLRALTSQADEFHETLERFDLEAVRTMVGSMLALPSPPESLVRFLHSQSKGNPFFIVEYLRAAIDDGLLRRDRAGNWLPHVAAVPGTLEERVALPRTLTALIERRLEGLDSNALSAVIATSVLGRGFDVELVARTSGLEVEEVIDAYATLRRRQILEDGSNGAAHFAHDKLREIAYSKADPARRAELHQRAAAAIENSCTPAELDTRLAELGNHYARAGDAEKAAEYYARAGAVARTSYANEDAVRNYRLAHAELEKCSDTASIRQRRCDVREALGDLLLLVGASEPARNELSAALVETPANAGIDRARRRRKLARTLEREHRHVEALDAYALATLELGDAPPAPELEEAWWFERIQIEADRANDLYFLSRVEELQELVERMRSAIEVRGLPAQRLQFYQAVAHMQMRRDRYVVSEEAMENARAYLVAAEQVNDIRELAVARFFCAFCHIFRATEVEAEPLFLGALKGAERTGDPALTTRFLAYYSVSLRRLQRTAEAREAALRTRSLAERGSATDYIGVACGNLCWTAWCEGSWAEAEALGREAVAAWDKLLPGYIYPIQWIARMPLAATLLELGRTDDAVEHWQVLLRPDQAELPVALRTAIEQAAHAERGSPERRLRALEVRDLCRKYKYL